MNTLRLTATGFLTGVLMCAVVVARNLLFHAVDPAPAPALAPDFGSTSVGSAAPPDPAAVRATWRQFRGPGNRGTTSFSAVPKAWSPTQNVAWETELPGRGSSSPICFFDRAFATSTSGYGESTEDPGDAQYIRHHVFCVNAYNGQTLWRKDLNGSPLAQPLNHQVMRHGLATSTPAYDGINVYAFFGASGVYALDATTGNVRWQADVGQDHQTYGSAASLTMFNDLLIVNASAESDAVVGLQRKNGRGIWRIPDVHDSWSTPVVGLTPAGEPELVVVDDGRVRGFDPQTGVLRWTCRIPSGYTTSTPAVHGGICYVTAGASRSLLAIRLGGQGDVTQSHLLWQTDRASRHTSPIFLSGFVYVLAENGVFKCYRATDGELVNSCRTPCRTRIYNSPILVGNYFYLPVDDDRVFVCEGNSSLRMLRDNRLGLEEPMVASICPSVNSLLLRRGSRLVCLAEVEAEKKIVVSNPKPLPLQEYRTRWDYDQETGQGRPYLKLLSRNRRAMAEAVLEPIADQLDYRQRSDAIDWLAGQAEPLDQLRQRHRQAYWEYLQAEVHSRAQLFSKLETIEAEALETAEALRRRLGERIQQAENHGIASTD